MFYVAHYRITTSNETQSNICTHVISLIMIVIIQYRRTDKNIMIVGTACVGKEGAMGYYRTGHWDKYHGDYFTL